jgi:hypothetical protein
LGQSGRVANFADPDECAGVSSPPLKEPISVSAVGFVKRRNASPDRLPEGIDVHEQNQPCRFQTLRANLQRPRRERLDQLVERVGVQTGADVAASFDELGAIATVGVGMLEAAELMALTVLASR